MLVADLKNRSNVVALSLEFVCEGNLQGVNGSSEKVFFLIFIAKIEKNRRNRALHF